MKEDASRQSYLDLAKFFAIVLVVAGHVMQYCVSEGESSYVFNFIWLLQIPLFMVVAGMLATKPSKVETASQLGLQLLRKATHYLVPCVSWIFVASAIWKTNPWPRFYDFYLNPESNLWFLWVLFLLSSLFTVGIYIGNRIGANWAKYTR